MSREVRVGDSTIRIEPFSGRKGIQALRAIDYISNAVPDIQKKWARYTTEYEATHTINIDRALARAEIRPEPLLEEQPVLDEDGIPLCDAQDRPLVRRVPMMRDGQVVMGPDPLGHLSEQDWAASGNMLRRPRSPRAEEQVLVILPDVLAAAEDQLAKLLGLIAMSNKDVKRAGRDGTLWEKAAEIGDEILDADLNEIVELAVVAGESLREEFRVKIRERLGERLVQVARLFGFDLGPTSSEKPSMTSPDSSTDSPPPTDGASPERSTEPAGVASAT